MNAGRPVAEGTGPAAFAEPVSLDEFRPRSVTQP